MAKISIKSLKTKLNWQIRLQATLCVGASKFNSSV